MRFRRRSDQRWDSCRFEDQARDSVEGKIAVWLASFYVAITLRVMSRTVHTPMIGDTFQSLGSARLVTRSVTATFSVASLRYRLVFIAAWLSLLLAVNAARAGDEPTALSAEERQVFERRLTELTERLAELRGKTADGDAAARDRWADVDVFRKGVQWALREQVAFTMADRQLIHKSLDQGFSRCDSLASGKVAWTDQRGRVVRGYVSEVDGSTQPFGVVVPASDQNERPTRLDVVLHGSTRPVGISELRFMDRFAVAGEAPAVDFIELHPLGRVENCYRWSGETDVFDAIEAVCRQYYIDRRRVVLRGMSMGASGTWHLGLKHPDRFVALGPYCGYVDTHRFSETPLPNFIKVLELPGHQELGLHLLDSVDYAANAEMVPAIAAMGEKDIFFDAHVLMGQALRREGLTMTNLLSPGTGHVIDPVTHAEQLRQISTHVARGVNRSPRRVRFVTWTLKYNRCHWLEIHGLDRHYHRAEVVAAITDDGTLDISRADNVRRLSIELDGLPQRPPTIHILGESVAIEGTRSKLCLVREADRWRQVAEDSLDWKSGKRPGLQGPIDDAFCSRFLCVRGTGTAWQPDVQAWADASLDGFADEWRRYFRGELPVKRDVDVTADDIARCHLVLFGDPGSNSWIMKALPQLPLTWTRDELRLGSATASVKDHVPVLIHPNPLSAGYDRYLVINSGHTFREAELSAVNYLLFPRLGDWAIRKADSSTARKSDPRIFDDPSVVETGFFDEAWHVPTR